MNHAHCKEKGHFSKIGLLAIASIVWLVFRTGMKPSRITYPCQRAAVANVNIFFLALFSPLLGLRKFNAALPNIINVRVVRAALLIGCLLLAFEFGTNPINCVPKANVFAPLKLTSHRAITSIGASDLFFIQNASSSDGNMDAAVSALIQLMANNGLNFFNTSQHTGLIAKDDVILIKVNCQWSQRGGTNTDLIKSIIKTVVNHPEGFTGEIVIADDGQGLGSLDWPDSNAFNQSQSMESVANMFPSYKVSTWLWDSIRSNQVNEYDQGDFRDGYVVNSTQNPVTNMYVSYPKFKTKYGTYISFSRGIWNTTMQTYNPQKLKIINAPVLKSHGMFGVTASVKHYMGVLSTVLSTDIHTSLAQGGMGTEMAETRFPTLNVLDSIWVNANPKESGNPGPITSYADASFTNVIGASTDPVALDYWAAKNILIPAAIQKGYSAYSSLDPDYAPVTPGLTESFHNYLERSMNQLKNAGYQVTMNESEINVYVSPPYYNHNIAITNGTLSKTVVGEGYLLNISVIIQNQGAYDENFNLTIYANTTAIHKETIMLISTQTGYTTFTWNTTGIQKGSYNMTAVATPVPNETNYYDNTFIYGMVKITIPGDVDGDFFVNVQDATIVGFYWTQAVPPAPPEADINDDHIINILDATVIGWNWLAHA
jgi:hypothetical protein